MMFCINTKAGRSVLVLLSSFLLASCGSGNSSVTPTPVPTSPPPAPTGAWTAKASIVFQRDNAANVVVDGQMYVLGGAPAGVGVLDSMEKYDQSVDSWTTMAAMPIWSSLMELPTWSTATAPFLPAYRYGLAAAPYDGKIYLVGGTRQVNGKEPIYPTALYDPATDSWSGTVPTNPATIASGTAGQPLASIPTGRWGFDVAVIDGIIYAVGGVAQVPGYFSVKTTPMSCTTTTCDIPALKDGHQYFQVAAVDANGNESAPSPEISARLLSGAPTGEGAVAGDGQATVTWVADPAAISYNFYYSTKPGVMSQVNSVSLPAGVTQISNISTATTTTTVSGLTNGQPYYFLATAVTASGEVLVTHEDIAVTPRAATATVPSNLGLSSAQAGITTLTWGPVTGAVSYNVYYGVGDNDYLNGSVEAYDPVQNTWAAKAPMPTPRWGSTVSVVDGKIYAIGGWGGWPELALVEVYDPKTDTWSKTVPVNAATISAGTAGKPFASMPTSRDDFGFAVLNGIIYAMGGDTNTFDDANRIVCCTSVVEAFDPIWNTWSTKTSMPTIRDDFDASVLDGVIYAVAGSRDGKFSNTVDVTQAWLDANDGGFSLTTVEAFSLNDIPPPGGVSAVKEVGQVSISWNPVAGATSYSLYWSNNAGVSTAANSSKVASVTSPYTFTGLTPGAWHYFVITAMTDAGESMPSNEVTVSP